MVCGKQHPFAMKGKFMTYSSFTNATLAAANTDELPRPETANTNSALPQPVRSSPDIADNGRIKFGAGYRLPLNK